MQDPFEIKGPRPQAAQWLRFGAIKPRGWLFNQIEQDLVDGFVGHLDRLVPDLILDDDIYGRDRLTDAVTDKDVGTRYVDDSNQQLWWNSETQSNWRDGFVRAALLVEAPAFLAKTKTYVDELLATQDEDGYLGIYAPDLRYKFTGENGELWAQASALRVLLAYFEATGEERVLTAVQNAVHVTMTHYPIDGVNPFAVHGSVCGVEHGLVFTDVLDRLNQLTGDETYLTYAHWLYKAYSQGTPNEKDIQYDNVVDPAWRLQGHGAHVYEHIRPLLTAVYAADNPLLADALTQYLHKVARCLTPSGGPIGDEWVFGRDADPGETGYEYCSIHELLDSYSHLLQKTGDLSWGDRIEWLLFNAGQGARHPQESAITYLNTDNTFSKTGTLHPEADEPEQNRYKYSPAHQDMAVCCAPNAGRIYPYYVKSIWLRTADGLAAALYGPSLLHTEIDGVPVRIAQETDYPFALNVEMRVETAVPHPFTLHLRRPDWCTTAEVRCAGAEITQRDGKIALRKTWQSGDVVEINFSAAVTAGTANDGSRFFRHGPLLYALPLEGEVWVEKTYALPGFRDLKYGPTADRYCLPVPHDAAAFEYAKRPFDPRQPWLSAGVLRGKLVPAGAKEAVEVELRPLGATILRQTTFTNLFTNWIRRK